MSIEEITPGLHFAHKYKLTAKEIQTLLPFFNKPHTAVQISEEIGITLNTLRPTIQRLSHKGLIVLKSRDENGSNILMFDTDCL